jgi:choline dehydrogenase-like flavoprotein
MVGALQQIHMPMRRFKNSDLVDYVIIGVGAAGGVLLQRLARAGFNVVGLEAGPFWDTERDWVSDEIGSHQLYWTDPRVTGGSDPLALGANNCGRGVGGGSVHWAAFTPRLHPSDFEVYTRDGVGADWPITYADILPYYEQLELEMPVAGPAYYPWGHPHGYAYGPHPMGGVGNALIKGCTALNIPVSIGGPVAILSGSHGDRPHCIYRGFCIQGCKVGAKASTLVTHVPDAVKTGAEVRDLSMAARIELDKNNRVTGVHYFDSAGISHFQRARAVIVSGYALETPRLLLNSACPGHERGLANSSGTLGRYLMAQAATSSSDASTIPSACTKRRPRTRSPKSFMRPIPRTISLAASPSKPSARSPSHSQNK